MYRDLQLIQSGTFSAVYKAYCTRRQEHVALKMISKQRYSAQSMRNELRVMQRLGAHPHVCALLGFFENETHYVVVLEHCECGDLFDFLQLAKRQGDAHQPALIRLQHRKVATQLVAALRHAHSLGIAHRDIKPENVLLTQSGDVKLADWGHAVIADRASDFDIGTDHYRAPETFKTKLHDSCESEHLYETMRADYWSLGITLTYLLFGECPFQCATLSAQSSFKAGKLYHCDKFGDFERDPYSFFYDRYFAKTLSLGDYNTGKAPKSTSAPYVSRFYWSDMKDTADLLSLSKVILETLLQVDPDSRSLRRFIQACNKSMDGFSDAGHLEDTPNKKVGSLLAASVEAQ